jgi:fructose-bisphosphate aldolase / 2-amino-3,7-dideoxy-D-threo-hept-6-ulosonate synthase
MTGKTRRMGRLFRGAQSRCLMVPMDHGPFMGPAKGIDRPLKITSQAVAGGANALLISPGFTHAVRDIIGPDMGLALRVSITAGLAPEAVQESPVATVDTALRMDADAVAVSIFFGRGGETAMMGYIGQLVEAGNRYGMPVLAEMMPPDDRLYDIDAIAHATRIGWEAGADVVKTMYSGNVEEFRDMAEGVPVPIIVAGGPSKVEIASSLVGELRNVLDAGASGVAWGRRVWGSSNPQELIGQMSKVMFSG